MIDFRTMGMQMGFSEALAIQARSADEAMDLANEIIARKNSRLAELHGEVDALNRQMDALKDEVSRLQGNLKDARTKSHAAEVDRESQWTEFLAGVQEQHRIAMVVADVRRDALQFVLSMMSESLDASEPGNDWSKPTGSTYPDGLAQVGRHQAFDMAYDRYMQDKDIPVECKRRAVASRPSEEG